MDINEAKKYLEPSFRSENRDHAFGDAEVFWVIGDQEVATGYFGGSMAHVSILNDKEENVASFEGAEARELRECGKTGAIGRNDSTGPDSYSEGKTMPGLTLEGVREELTGG